MRIIKKTVCILDKYRKGKVKHIDFTYQDHIVIWIEYKNKCVGYLWQ